MSDLTIVTVTENDLGILDLMVKSVIKFTKPMPNFVICNNGNSPSIEKYRNKKNFTIIDFKPSMSGGSNRHGEALNKALSIVQTNKTAILESDCVVLRSGWDTIPDNKNVLASIKGNTKLGPFYHVCYLVFKTKVLQNMDFRPGNDNNRGNRNYKPNEDVGAKTASYLDHSVVALADFVDCKTGHGEFFDERFQSDEFWRNGKAYVAHFGRGSNIAGKAVRKGFDHPKTQLELWKEKALEILNG